MQFGGGFSRVPRRGRPGTPGGSQHHPYWLLTISAGEHTARAALAWADESLAALDADEPSAGDVNT
jgi:hypothetical protein